MIYTQTITEAGLRVADYEPVGYVEENFAMRGTPTDICNEISRRLAEQRGIDVLFNAKIQIHADGFSNRIAGDGYRLRDRPRRKPDAELGFELSPALHALMQHDPIARRVWSLAIRDKLSQTEFLELLVLREADAKDRVIQDLARLTL